MKTAKHILTAAAAMAVFSSCSDILDKKPLDIMSDANVWEDPVLMDAYLAQQYEFTPALVQDATECITGNWGLSAVSAIGDFNLAMYCSDKMGGQFATTVLCDEGTGGVPCGAEAYKWSGLTEGGAGVLDYYELPYKTIRNLNEFIERVPGSPMDPQMAELRVAEARFLRAFNYFYMVKRYGGVPLVLKVQQMTDPKEELYPKRDSEKRIYDFVISEMDDIAGTLSRTTDYGRPTKYAAMALKCRAALYAGRIAEFGTEQLDGLLGFPKSDAQTYYDAAFKAAEVIINDHVHDLYDENSDKVQNFKDVFLVKRNKEIILAKQHTYTDFYSGGNGFSWNFCVAPLPNAWGLGGNYAAPYLEMAEAFEYADGRPGTIDRAAIQEGLWDLNDIFGDKDPRFYASIWMQDTPWALTGTGKVEFYRGLLLPDGTVLDSQNEGYGEGENAVSSWGTQATNGTRTGFGIMKMVDETQPMPGDQGREGQDYPVFRFGEVLLNYAEAAFKLGKTDRAFWAINRIRERAGVRQYQSESEITEERIRHERQVELAFEGHRYWDLRCWRIAEEKLNGTGISGLRYILDYNSYLAHKQDPANNPLKYRIEVVPQATAETGEMHFRPENYYFPIGLSRRGQNPNLAENPGYSN